MPHDPRLQQATARYARSGRQDATEQEKAEARRDLAAIKIEVNIDRALADCSIPLTEEQVTRLTARFAMFDGAR